MNFVYDEKLFVEEYMSKFIIRHKYHNDTKTIALINAVRNNDINIVNELIKNGVDVNNPQTYNFAYGYYVSESLTYDFPLIDAIKWNRYEIVKLLFHNKANPNVIDDQERTALSAYLETTDLFNKNFDLELFILFLKKGSIIRNKDIIILERIFHKCLVDQVFTIKNLVSIMKEARLFEIIDASKPSIAETFYNKLEFLKKDYPSFTYFFQADQFPSLLLLAAKAATLVIAEYLQLEKKSKKVNLINNLNHLEISQNDNIEPLVKLLNQLLPKEYQLNSISQIVSMIDDIEYQPLGESSNSN